MIWNRCGMDEQPVLKTVGGDTLAGSIPVSSALPN